MGVAMEATGDEEYTYYAFNILWVSFGLLGSGALLYYIIDGLHALMDLCARKGISFEDLGAKQGFWAVVTGATSDIGKEMALQLADRGFNIVMLSHSQVKMDEIAKEIEAKGMMAKAYSVDFASCSGEQWEEIDKIVQERKVSILINNVELNHRYPIYFDEEEHSACDDMVEVNINTMMNLTRIAVPQMRERKNGLILNMGSYASARSMPFMSVYAGTKGFVKTYSQSLAYELEADGIVVNQVFNFWVASEVSGYRAPSQLVPSPQQYVQCLLERTGLRCGSTDSYTSIPYHTHSFLNLLISYFWDPRLAQPVFYNFAHNLYRLGQKKQAKEKAWRETLDRAVKEEIARLKALEIEQTGLQSKDVSANA